MENNSKIIMHIDVNSAFLSWQAAYNDQVGIDKDIRNIPSVIGGNEEKRHGIVLAKSLPAKRLGIQTGESLMDARMKCKNLLVVPPNYDLYVKASKALITLLKEYSPYIDIFSIDECFLDFTGMEEHFGDPIKAAHKIKERIKSELGFTVNIGISSNKLLAKQAGELQKPDKVNTLFLEEVKNKLWPLPVEELFMVGRKTKPKLNRLGIYTIGDLANSDFKIIDTILKSHGRLVYNYAWGRDDSTFNYNNYIPFKSVGNGSTIPFDVEDRETAKKIILSLCETTSRRIRRSNVACGVISLGIRNLDLFYRSHQRKILSSINSTEEIYQIALELFDDIWDGTPIRKFSLRLSQLTSSEKIQSSLFDKEESIKLIKINETIDTIRERFGDYSVTRATFLHSGLKPMLGGFAAEDYPVMSSIL
ncbi:DNA polymerase IV [Clostridium sp. D2Q-11]|uniref:DNA polymerase IV n=1 Tax=Anaeromonas frigoriresistens TaxID=2683708 RepID=A0A942Z9Q4_9FIRM|nr:DNA polymerase IV [Anaeromonas frigoriresistens]MBS4539075.1 DNA polymerase IV [Anaeromonas frigoriresistens]